MAVYAWPIAQHKLHLITVFIAECFQILKQIRSLVETLLMIPGKPFPPDL